MSTTFLNQLGVIPALLIVLACVLVLRDEKSEKAKRRLLLFLFGLGVLLLTALYTTMRYMAEPYNRSYFQFSYLLASSIFGVTALILLNIKEFVQLGRGAKVIGILLAVVMVVLYGFLWNTQFGLGYLIAPGVLILVIGWSIGRRFSWIIPVLGVSSSAILFAMYRLVTHPPTFTDSPTFRAVGSVLFIAFYVAPGLSVVMSGLFLTTSLQSFRSHAADGGRISPRGRLLIGIIFSVISIGFLAYIIFWGSVWDHTSDGLMGIFALQPSAFMAVGVGMVMVLALRGSHRIAGIVFILIVPILLYQSFEAGWRVSYHEITERRAAQIARALDRFHAREGYYPDTLDSLVPRDLLFVQQPVILAGEKWCYEGNKNFYRLSAFYREYFSSPVSLQVYETVGDLPASPSLCESRLAEMKEKYYSPMEDPNAMRPPLPTPLPEIEVGISKTDIQPVLNGAVALPGGWSVDGAYFFFATQADGLTLHFLNGSTGEICTSDAQYSLVDGIRERYAWLPDGRLLYVDSTGEVVVLTPCQDIVEQLTDRLPGTFDQIGAYSPESGRALLQNKDAFWILDARTFEVQPIPGVTPNIYELHWDQSAWLPGGEQLVISRLNGRQGSNEGATLYLINGNTGEVQNSVVLEGDFGQGAPWVEGISETEVLLQAQGSWQLLDLSVNPVKFTNVMTDIFDLDIKFPDEISASGSYVNKDGNGYYLAVRLNHARNQATYLYSSETERVYIYEHEYHTLLVFPDGSLMEMAKLELVPTYTDQYDLVMVDKPEVVYPRLVLAGHTPREYPHLNIRYLRQSSQLVVASAHGVSLVSLPDGEMKAYWTLIGDGFSPWLSVSPDGSALVAAKDFGGMYYIPLP